METLLVDVEDEITLPHKNVFVVMGNDFPDSVWSNEQVADAYVIRNQSAPNVGRKIYWRVYDFTLDIRGMM
jgi:hypothetical protein